MLDGCWNNWLARVTWLYRTLPLILATASSAELQAHCFQFSMSIFIKGTSLLPHWVQQHAWCYLWIALNQEPLASWACLVLVWQAKALVMHCCHYLAKNVKYRSEFVLLYWVSSRGRKGKLKPAYATCPLLGFPLARTPPSARGRWEWRQWTWFGPLNPICEEE